MPDETKTRLDGFLEEFQAECDNAVSLYHTALALHNTQPEMFSEAMKNMLTESVVLQLFGRWERFLESIFIEYMCGGKSANGSAAVRYVFPTGAEHAYQLVQNVNAYPDWADLEKVSKNANNFFENGGPFGVLNTMKAEINAIRKVRNAIAHTSKNATEKFEDLVRGKVGYLPERITPAKFLSEYKIGKRKKDPTFCEHYIEYLKSVAGILVEYSVEPQ